MLKKMAKLQSLKSKIPCYVFTFFMHENFKKCMDTLLKKSQYLDIKVIENKSKYTETEFKPYIMDLINQGVVSEYFLFDENISNNATQEVFLNCVDYSKSACPFVMITDGDLLFENDWLEEEYDILVNNENIYCVGVDLCMDNLPKVVGAESWVPKPKKKLFKNYNIGNTGCWGCLFKLSTISDVIQNLSETEVWVDGMLHKDCANKKQIWARTKRNKAYHLTWDNYSDPNDEYNLWKSSMSFVEHWNNKRSSTYTIYDKDGIKQKNMSS